MHEPRSAGDRFVDVIVPGGDGLDFGAVQRVAPVGAADDGRGTDVFLRGDALGADGLRGRSDLPTDTKVTFAGEVNGAFVLFTFERKGGGVSWLAADR